MRISELIVNLEEMKNRFGDYELLFCDQNGAIHFNFSVGDWSEPDCPLLLLRGYTPTIKEESHEKSN